MKLRKSEERVRRVKVRDVYHRYVFVEIDSKGRYHHLCLGLHTCTLFYTHQLSPFHTFFENEGVREREKDFTFIEIQFRPFQCSQQTLDRTIDIPRLLTPIHTSEILYSISRVGEGMCYLISILYSQYPFPAQLPRQQVIV